MEKCKSKILISLILLFAVVFPFFSNESNRYCGTWAHLSYKKEVDECLSVQRIDEERYFVTSTYFDDHVLDFAGIATVFDENKLLYKHKLDDGTEENFFIYFDFDMDYAYVLWNHEVPDYEYYDVQLERVSKLYDKEYQKALEEESQEKLNKAIIDWIKNP